MWATCCERHYDALCMEIDMWLTPKLISKCSPNPNFSANHEDNENDQVNKTHPDNKNEGIYRENKYMFKVSYRKKSFGVFMVIFGHISHVVSVFNVDFEHVIVHYLFFHYKYQTFMF